MVLLTESYGLEGWRCLMGIFLIRTNKMSLRPQEEEHENRANVQVEQSTAFSRNTTFTSFCMSCVPPLLKGPCYHKIKD